MDTENKTNPIWTQKENLTDDDVTKKNRTRERTEDNETEQRRDEQVLLDRVVDRLGGLSGRPSGRPVSDPPKTTQMGPGPAGTPKSSNFK